MKRFQPKVSMISMGCPKNLVDSEVMLGILKNKGYSVTVDEPADITIINTCSFIESSVAESVDKIMEMGELKKKGKIKVLVVAGCLANRYGKNELVKGFDAVDAFIGSGDVNNIAGIIEKVLPGKKIFVVDSKPGFLYNAAYKRRLLTPGHYVYVKIAEGCRNRCSYCLIPRLRGDYRSRKIPSVLKEIRNLSGQKRIAEINLIAQDTTYYGTDIYGKRKLSLLLKKVSALGAARWIRLLYTHPAHFDDELISVIAGEPSICKYVDLPLQHINDRVLARMGRKSGRAGIEALIKKLRSGIPGVVIRTSLIVGFPGETEKQFSELLEFVKGAGFDRLGVFEYSREKGTRAYAYRGQVSSKVKQARHAALMQAQQQVSLKKNRARIGSTLEVLVDGIDREENILLCRTPGDAPEIDCYVIVKSGTGKPGDFIRVKVTGATAYDLLGKKL